MKKSQGLSLLYFSNDIQVVGEIADRVAIMYAGKIVEFGPVQTIFKNPNHPYTRGLMGATIRLGERNRVEPIEGEPPDIFTPPSGCAFAQRCSYTLPLCRKQTPPNTKTNTDHYVQCHRHNEI